MCMIKLLIVWNYGYLRIVILFNDVVIFYSGNNVI